MHDSSRNCLNTKLYGKYCKSTFEPCKKHVAEKIAETYSPEDRKLKSLADAAEIALDYHEYPGMVHDWMFLRLPESKKAKQQIFELINTG